MDQRLIQSPGVFEITDYTSVTDWERFTANLEEILSDWKLNKQTKRDDTYQELSTGFISSGVWREERDTITYSKIKFEIRYLHLDLAHLSQTKEDQSKKPESPDRLTGSDSEFQDACDHKSEEQDDYIDYQKELPRQEDKEHREHELPEILPECLNDMLLSSNDFASRAHCLVRWYNLRRFIVITPKSDVIVSESKLKLLLSASSVALSNIDCHVPIFVQIHDPKKNFYQGISEHRNIRTLYETITFRHRLSKYEYLSDLLSVFREKVGCTLNDPINVSIRLNYCLENFDIFNRMNSEFLGPEQEDELIKMTQKKAPEVSGRSNIMDLKGDATFEQVIEAMKVCTVYPSSVLRFIHVAALWPPISDKVFVDSQVHSDLNPAEAPIWTIRTVCRDSTNMWIVNQTQAINELLSGCVDYAYDEMDAETVFEDCSRDTLKSRCLRLSYDLARSPEVILSDQPSDSIRKLISLLLSRANEIKTTDDAFQEVVSQLKKKPSLNEVYRTFNQNHRPSVKEFILRTQITRPFCPISTPALPQRMFCTICDNEFRLCGAFSELCN